MSDHIELKKSDITKLGPRGREIKKKRIPTWLLIFVFVYIISPIDLLPFNPLDDILVFLGGIMLHMVKDKLKERLFGR